MDVSGGGLVGQTKLVDFYHGSIKIKDKDVAPPSLPPELLMRWQRGGERERGRGRETEGERERGRVF